MKVMYFDSWSSGHFGHTQSAAKFGAIFSQELYNIKIKLSAATKHIMKSYKCTSE
jgi:hypothetical protein